MTDSPLTAASRGRALFTITLVNFVSLAGFGLMFPVFAVYGRQIGASGIEIAGTVAAFSFGGFLSSPIWGRLSDRYGRRNVMFAGLAIGALVYVLHIYATTPASLLVVRFISGLTNGCFSITFAVASDISTRETRTRDMGIVSSGFSLGFIFGPAIGGFASSITGQDHAFTLVSLVGAAMGLLAAAVTWFLLPETATMHDPVSAAPAIGSVALLRLPAFATLTFISFLASAAFSKLEAILGLFADDVLGLDPLRIGLMFGGMGVVTTITQLTLTGPTSRRLGDRGTMQAALATIGIGMLVLGCAHDLLVAGIGLTFTSLGFGLLNPALSGLTSLATPPSAQGMGLGLMQAANSLGRVFGPLMAGPLYDLLGPPAPLLWGAAMFAGTLVAACLFPVVAPQSTAR
ncbi:MFS transporter [Novosphingobium sp. fls2-241-R2A-195]|jgi:MFS family permease|uniref:MFS transporter n=1 Tax=Novosphingobium sp. fls2-241-R2A-195 TaxID=3040296 RepID=UPI00254AFC47|nr:MFS transporter [Novosphingobium sp. fls2-241-R2A-195]